VDSVTLGQLTVRNVPVNVLPTRQLSKPVFSGKRVDGIIGTVLLSRFLATLDYPGGRLIVRPNDPKIEARLVKGPNAADSIAVPFWMAGDHYMVAWGTIGKSRPHLLFVDTGLAGGGVTCSKAMLEEAGISLDEKNASEGIGGGGKVRVVPFMAPEMTLGAVREQNVRGLFTEAFPLEDRLGFRIGGLVSHGFFRSYALTFDFVAMRLFLKKGS
jgi:hypothetical protein